MNYYVGGINTLVNDKEQTLRTKPLGTHNIGIMGRDKKYYYTENLVFCWFSVCRHNCSTYYDVSASRSVRNNFKSSYNYYTAVLCAVLRLNYIIILSRDGGEDGLCEDFEV